MANFHWSETTELAAQLIAARNLTYGEIAEKLDVSVRALWNWRQDDEFKARVEEHLADIREEVKRIGIADRHKRIATYNDLWNRLRKVMEDRADSPEMQAVPGGSTGLMTRTVKGIGSGEDFEVVELFAVDTGLIRELRETAKQAAIELGQWVEKRETSEMPPLPPEVTDAVDRVWAEHEG